MITNHENNAALICVDAGTTNTRVWMTRGERILAKAQAAAGVRDTARDGSNARLQAALGDLIAQVCRERPEDAPACVIAAGMITSPLGLREVPHIPAPAGIAELAAAVDRHGFPNITALPILLVPGVRVGPAPCELDAIGAADVIRGEETLVAGLAATGKLGPRATLLNLGSHWKAIRLDDRSRIAASVTSMSGELIHTAQTQTILADAVPHQRPAGLDPAWLEAGMREQRQAGLARALFCVRLLHQRCECSPDKRLAFLIGAFLAADLDALISRKVLTPDSPVAITGGGLIAESWQSALARAEIASSLVGESEVEAAMLAGFGQIARAAFI
ncbi:MAG: 2-dehydro-3-deoxygalactonokinase [Blastocatellia bacterium]